MSEFVEVKTAELSGAALDWAVAVVVHGKVYVYPDGGFCPPEDTVSMNDDDGSLWVNSGIDPHPKDSWSPSTDWSQGGPLIEKYLIELGAPTEAGSFSGIWNANHEWGHINGYQGHTPLIAACRAIVASVLGDTVSVPKELLV